MVDEATLMPADGVYKPVFQVHGKNKERFPSFSAEFYSSLLLLSFFHHFSSLSYPTFTYIQQVDIEIIAVALMATLH